MIKHLDRGLFLFLATHFIFTSSLFGADLGNSQQETTGKLSKSEQINFGTLQREFKRKNGGIQCSGGESLSIITNHPLLFSTQGASGGIAAEQAIASIVEASLPPSNEAHAFSISMVPPIEGQQTVSYTPVETIYGGAHEFSSVGLNAVVSAHLNLCSSEQVTFQCQGLLTNPCSSMNPHLPVRNFSGSFEITAADLLYNSASSLLSVRANYDGKSLVSNTIPTAHQKVEQAFNIFPGENDALHSWKVVGNNLYATVGSPQAHLNTKLFRIATDDDGSAQIDQITNLSNVPEAPHHNDRVASMTPCPFAENAPESSSGDSALCFTAFSWPNAFLYRYTGSLLERIGNLSNHALVSTIGEVHFDGTSFFTSGYDINMQRAVFRIDPVNGGEVYQAHRLSSNLSTMWNMKKSGSALYFVAWPVTAPGILAAYTYVHVIHHGTIKRLFDTSYGINPAPQDLFAFRDGAVFSARNAQGQYRIYQYSHVSNQLTVFPKTNPLGDDYGRIAHVDEERGVYFQANDANGKWRLFLFDGDEIRQLFNLDSDGEYLRNITPWGDHGFYFVADFSSAASSLYYYDYSAATVIRITNDVKYPDLITLAGEQVYFTAYNSDLHQKLYVFDRIQNYVAKVSDINPGHSDYINQVIYYSGDIYFDAQNSAGQSKIYAVKR